MQAGVQADVVGPQCLFRGTNVHEWTAASGASSVAARVGGRSPERLRADVTEEIVAGEDVVDLEAQRARETLAHVALQQGLVVDGGTALAVREQAGGCGAAARLAGVGRLHEGPSRVKPGDVQGV